jgi:hypothetical protein
MATCGGKPIIIKKGSESIVPPPTIVPNILANMPIKNTENKVITSDILFCNYNIVRICIMSESFKIVPPFEQI